MENTASSEFDGLPVAKAVINEVIEKTSPATTEQLEVNSKFQPFDIRSVAADKTAGMILFAVLAIAAIIGLVVLFFNIGLGWIFYSVLAAISVAFIGLLYMTLGWPKVEYRHRSWRLSDVGLEIQHGVWWKHKQAVPWARVQHADVSQGPIQRAYGIGTLTVHTAGTANSSVNLAGLSHEKAVELRDEIIRQRAASDVV